MVLGSVGSGPVLCADPAQDAPGEAPGDVYLHRGGAEEPRCNSQHSTRGGGRGQEER